MSAYVINMGTSLFLVLLNGLLLVDYFQLTSTAANKSSISEKNDSGPSSSSNGNLTQEDDADVRISIGTIENDEVVPTDDIDDYREFKSDKTYIIVVETGSSKEEDEFWDVFYWIGKESTDLDAMGAALNAVLVHSTISSTIRREAEGKETRVFKTLFRFNKEKKELEKKASASKSTSDSKLTKMILIEGQEIAHLQQVEFSLSHTERDDACLVIFNPEIVYTYCGITVEENVQIRMAKTLARIILKKMGPRAKDVSIFMNQESNLSQEKMHIVEEFYKELKRISKMIGKQKSIRRESENKPSKAEKKKSFLNMFCCRKVEVIERVNEMNKKDKKPEEIEEESDLKITRIYLDVEAGNLKEETLMEIPSSLFPFISDDCYVIDPCSKIGLCVWMGISSQLDVRVECARQGELILRRRINCPPRPIAFFDEEDIDLPAEPRLRVHLQNFIRLMEDLNLSWDDVLKKDSTADLLTKLNALQEPNPNEPSSSQA